MAYAVGGRNNFSRAYLHDLALCGEKVNPMQASIHNLHYDVDMMRALRAVLDAGGFASFRERF